MKQKFHILATLYPFLWVFFKTLSRCILFFLFFFFFLQGSLIRNRKHQPCYHSTSYNHINVLDIKIWAFLQNMLVKLGNNFDINQVSFQFSALIQWDQHSADMNSNRITVIFNYIFSSSVLSILITL